MFSFKFKKEVTDPYQALTRGISTALRVRDERRLKGRGDHKRAIPLAVLSVYNGFSCSNG